MDIMSALAQVIVLSTLTVGVTTVYKQVITDKNTQRVSVIIAMILALVTGTSILVPLGFSPATNFIDKVVQFKLAYQILFYLGDLGVTGFLSSKGANFIVDLFSKKDVSQDQTKTPVQ